MEKVKWSFYKCHNPGLILIPRPKTIEVLEHYLYAYVVRLLSPQCRYFLLFGSFNFDQHSHSSLRSMSIIFLS